MSTQNTVERAGELRSETSLHPSSLRGPSGRRASASVDEGTEHSKGSWLPSVQQASSSLLRFFRNENTHSSPSVAQSTINSRVGEPSLYGSTYGGLENMASPADLVTPRSAKKFGREVARVMETARRYQESIRAMSDAAAEFGAALESCSRSKAAGQSSNSIQTIGGLHMLVSNHMQILASSLQEKFVVPISRALAKFSEDMARTESEFRVQLHQCNRDLRTAEAQSRRLSRKRSRNLVEYRSTLVELTGQIDDIGKLKFTFLSDIFHLSGELSMQLVNFLSSVVTAQVEIFEGIARKGWSGGGLDSFVNGSLDPFGESASASPGDRAQNLDVSNLFSVLPPTSLLPQSETTPDADDSAASLTIASSPDEAAAQ